MQGLVVSVVYGMIYGRFWFLTEDEMVACGQWLFGGKMLHAVVVLRVG
jgi:hypothetical protein